MLTYCTSGNAKKKTEHMLFYIFLQLKQYAEYSQLSYLNKNT